MRTATKLVTVLRRSGDGPAAIPGLQLWFDAKDPGTLFQDSGGTIPATALNDPVGRWGDKSGNGWHATQGSTSMKGTYRPDLNLILFAADALVTTYNAALTNFCVFCVFAESSGVVSHERLVDKLYLSGFWLGRNATTANSWGGGIQEAVPPYGSFTTLSDAAAKNILMMQREGTTKTLRGNASISTSTVSGAATDNAHISLGGPELGGVGAGTTALAEVILYNRSLTPEEQQAMFSYLNGKWGAY